MGVFGYRYEFRKLFTLTPTSDPNFGYNIFCYSIGRWQFRCYNYHPMFFHFHSVKSVEPMLLVAVAIIARPRKNRKESWVHPINQRKFSLIICLNVIEAPQFVFLFLSGKNPCHIRPNHSDNAHNGLAENGTREPPDCRLETLPLSYQPYAPLSFNSL